MLSLENFLEIIFKANLTSTYVAGQLIAFNKTKSKVVVVNSGGRNLGFNIRCIFLSLFAFSNILRVINLRFGDSNESILINKRVETSLCIMAFWMVIVIADRYKTWTYSPEKYVCFLNAIIKLKRNQLKGIFPSESKKTKKMFLLIFECFQIINRNPGTRFSKIEICLPGFKSNWIFLRQDIPLCSTNLLHC